MRKKGRAVPKELDEDDNPPTLDIDLAPIFKAWTDLMDSRQASSYEGIWWSEISTYCDDHGVHAADKGRWCRLVKSLDRWFLDSLRKQETNVTQQRNL